MLIDHIVTLGSIFASSFLIGLSGALMPGPLLTVTVSESSRRGAVAGPLLIAGHGILELGLLVLLLLGLAPVLQQDAVFITISLIGSGILIWMAVGMFRVLPTLTLKIDTGQSSGERNLVLAGALISVANPYWTIWWASIGVGYILYSFKYGGWGIFSFFCGHILADLVWYSAVSVAVWKGRNFLSDRAYRHIIAVCAACLVFFAGWFAWSGTTKLIGLC